MTDKDRPDDEQSNDSARQAQDKDNANPEARDEAVDSAAKTSRGSTPTSTERAILNLARSVAAQQAAMNPAILQAAADAARHVASVNALNFNPQIYRPLIDPAFFGAISQFTQIENTRRAVLNLLGRQDLQWRQLVNSTAAAQQAMLQNQLGPMQEAMRRHTEYLSDILAGMPSFNDFFTNFSRSLNIGWQQLFPDLKKLRRDIRARLLASFVHAELWPAPSMSADLFDTIADLPQGGDRRPITLAVWNHYRRNDHAALESAISAWWDDPEYAARRHIIEEALRGHKAKLYALTIPGLLTQVEGIASDFVHGSVPGSPGSAVPKLGKTNQVIEHAVKAAGNAGIKDLDDADLLHVVLMESVIEYVQCVSFENTNFATQYATIRKRRTLNRHGILHGIQIRYPSAMNSLRCFLLLDALYALRKHARQVALQQTPQPTATPKPKRPSPRRRASRPPGP